MPAPPKDTEDFLSRWSRRKQVEKHDAAPQDAMPPDAVPPDAVPEAPAEPERELTDEELLAELDLPDPDTMKAEDDFSAFMQTRVPERLRRRALRVLWRSNPVLANLDKLVDYGEDFTDSATVVENMQTVYEVGKGAAEKWKRHLAALAEAEKDAPETEASEIEASETATTVQADPNEPEQPAVALAEPAPQKVAALAEPNASLDDPPVHPRPAHMRFAFE